MIELSTAFIISQILAFFAIISDFFSFQFKERKYIIIFFTISASLLSVHYFLLEKIATALIVGFGVLRYISSYFTTDKKIMYFFILGNTIILFLTFKEYLDILSFTAVIIGIVAAFQKNDKVLRILMMVCTSVMTLYNIIIFTPVGVLVEVLFLSSNFIGYYRHYIKK